MFENGQIITKENYTRAAIWCNANGAHIEVRDGQYVIVKNAPAPEPTAAERVAALESRYGLPRAARTALLALQEQGAELDETLMARVAEVEEAAKPLRQAQEPAEEEAAVSKTEQNATEEDTQDAAV